MDDMERYGDYNEVDESPRKSPVLRFIKAIAVVLIFSVIGFLIFRLFTFNYYPEKMSKLYFTDGLREYYYANEGNIKAETQELRAAYDDADEGNFFCDNLIVVKDYGRLEVSVRYNVSLMEALSEKFKIEEPDPNDENIFSFRLYRNGSFENSIDGVVGELVHIEWDSFLMYRYAKLVFDGIDFGSEDSDDKIKWLRLEIFMNGVEVSGDSEPFMVPIYENNDQYSSFDEYKISSGEVER